MFFQEADEKGSGAIWVARADRQFISRSCQIEGTGSQLQDPLSPIPPCSWRPFHRIVNVRDASVSGRTSIQGDQHYFSITANCLTSTNDYVEGASDGIMP